MSQNDINEYLINKWGKENSTEEFQFKILKGNRKPTLAKHHSNNCCIQEPPRLVEISGWKFERKETLCLVPKYLPQNIY